jgi:hypothetical protein
LKMSQAHMVETRQMLPARKNQRQSGLSFKILTFMPNRL